jgi:hypothetical protein
LLLSFVLRTGGLLLVAAARLLLSSGTASRFRLRLLRRFGSPCLWYRSVLGFDRVGLRSGHLAGVLIVVVVVAHLSSVVGHPRWHRLLLTLSRRAKQLLRLLAPLARQVVRRETPGGRVVIGVDFVSSAHGRPSSSDSKTE